MFVFYTYILLITKIFVRFHKYTGKLMVTCLIINHYFVVHTLPRFAHVIILHTVKIILNFFVFAALATLCQIMCQKIATR